jgi:predicted nucleic acid-binding protein
MDDVCIAGTIILYELTLSSYDSFKIFMGLPTTGGPVQEKKKEA